MDRLRFWNNHLVGFDETTMTGKCPSCRNYGFTILWDDQFVCLRCDLKGKGIKNFIEWIGAYRLPDLRVLVRAEQNRKILETQYENREDIPYDQITGMVKDLEDQRFLIWDRLARTAVRSEVVDGEEKRIVEGFESLNDLTKTLAKDLGQEEGQVRNHVGSLCQFNDIEIGEIGEIRIRYLWRMGV